MAQTSLAPKVVETITLKKFNGDGPIDRTDEPEEIITIRDGKIIEHLIRGEKQ